MLAVGNEGYRPIHAIVLVVVVYRWLREETFNHPIFGTWITFLHPMRSLIVIRVLHDGEQRFLLMLLVNHIKLHDIG